MFGKVWKYASVSVFSTVLTAALVAIFFDALKLSAIAATLWANVLSTIPAYFLTRNWAWGKSGRSHFWQEVVPFWAIAGVSAVLAAVVSAAADAEVKHFTHSHSLETIVVTGTDLFVYGVIWVIKFFLFNNILFATPKPAESEKPVSETADV